LKTDFRLALFGLISTGIQIILGIAVFFQSDAYLFLKKSGFGAAMKNAHVRLLTVEHPTMGLLALLSMLYGFRRMYYQPVARRRFLSIVIFYTLALLFIFSRIPWNDWL
jgi:hypothetical protein